MPQVTGRHVYHRPVRFADIDAQGHVNNVRLVEYLEDARISFFFDYVRDSDGDIDPGSPLPGVAIARHEVNYRRPLRFRHDEVRIESWVTKIGHVRTELAAEIRDDHEVFAEARSTVVAFDLDTQRPRRFTTDERAYLRRYLV
ncbi:thioesterase family protein [Spongiactinospora sp. TRM90649]|nr:thioesterase family protein [Spongiactinospora sp. TRM90649]MDF5752442.1 thioesterase family protein [Spongiactinospora sp. TRM90649]